MRVIAAIHVAVALGLVVAIGGLWNWGDPSEAICWGFPTILLLTMAWGLWRRQAWALDVVSIAYRPMFDVGIVPLLLCLSYYFLVPARGIAVLHVFAALGILLLFPAVLVTGSTVWFLKRRTSSEQKKGQDDLME
ncbi:hypothetical protein [Bythopirellula polymerisocia]|uniref:Uncharacterized protein n=1 Tax=Bythopirellula polymerisocia TaxID=2528003 RepID=A0A5C6D156_9BACT|nr:hypothetical protein [Bythopirellula polymerisocia]TWU29481.1 hypothetical protein Pla144_02590 [Bythopirellula polymerisocia]